MAVAAPIKRTDEPRPHLWTKDEYYRMTEIGMFDHIHVELIEGQVIEITAMLSPGTVSTKLTAQALERAFGPGYHAREQKPLDVGEASQPEPDVVIVKGDVRDYASGHPTQAFVVVEVSESSLHYDRNEKASLYAKAGVQDYWIINVKNRQMEVLRDPVEDASKPFGYGYRARTVLNARDSITPLAAPQVKIEVADLLP